MNSHKNIEGKLKSAVSKATPDVLDEILEKCKEVRRNDNESKGVVIDMKKPINKNGFLKIVSLVAAAIAIVALGSYGYIGYNNSPKVDAVIALDVNPSIELKVNKAERVIGIDAINEDAKAVLGDVDFVGMKLEEAIKTLMGSMLEKGYITDVQNSILVTVNNDNQKRSQKLEKKLLGKVEAALEKKAIKASVTTQLANGIDEALLKQAQDNEISIGKAKIINSIVEQNEEYSFEELAKMSIHDIQIIIKSNDIQLGNAKQKGDASTKAYIGEKAAKQAALKHLGQNNAEEVIVSLKYKDGKMTYQVRVLSQNAEIQYRIDAENGKIIRVETKNKGEDKNIGKTEGKGSENGNQTTSKPADSKNSSAPYGTQDGEGNNVGNTEAQTVRNTVADNNNLGDKAREKAPF